MLAFPPLYANPVTRLQRRANRAHQKRGQETRQLELSIVGSTGAPPGPGGVPPGRPAVAPPSEDEQRRRRGEEWLRRTRYWDTNIRREWAATKVLGTGAGGVCGLFRRLRRRTKNIPAVNWIRHVVVKQSARSARRHLEKESRFLRVLGYVQSPQ